VGSPLDRTVCWEKISDIVKVVNKWIITSVFLLGTVPELTNVPPPGRPLSANALAVGTSNLTNAWWELSSMKLTTQWISPNKTKH